MIFFVHVVRSTVCRSDRRLSPFGWRVDWHGNPTGRGADPTHGNPRVSRSDPVESSLSIYCSELEYWNPWYSYLKLVICIDHTAVQHDGFARVFLLVVQGMAKHCQILAPYFDTSGCFQLSSLDYQRSLEVVQLKLNNSWVQTQRIAKDCNGFEPCD
jgi:hypothetical protein